MSQPVAARSDEPEMPPEVSVVMPCLDAADPSMTEEPITLHPDGRPSHRPQLKTFPELGVQTVFSAFFSILNLLRW